MTTAFWVYVAVAPVAMVAGAAVSEHERRTSTKAVDREATLKPGLDGIVVGIAWPALALLGVACAAFWIVAMAGRLVVAAWNQASGSASEHGGRRP